MNFEDTLKVGVVNYDTGESGYDEDGNPIDATDIVYQDFGKCAILPNTSAKTVTLEDGSAFVYSYEVFALLNTKKYKILPKEGDKVWITKKDGTIDKAMEVQGFVTYKKRYLKIWV